MHENEDTSSVYIEHPDMEYRVKCFRAMSARLHQVAAFVKPCSAVADIGCDHGYVSIDLLNRGITEKVIAIEVRQGPLIRVQEHCRQAGLQEQMECRLSDGMDQLHPGEVDCAVIAGMGGILMIDILDRARQRGVLPDSLVLQPQSDIPKVRGYLPMIGYQIEKEAFLLDKGKYYTVMRVERNGQRDDYTETELVYGRYLLLDQDPVLYEYLIKEHEDLLRLEKRLQSAIADTPTEKLQERMPELKRQIAMNQSAQAYYMNKAE